MTIIKVIAGGFSGAVVLLAKSVSSLGHEEGPFVLKLDSRAESTKERVNFERVQDALGNIAPKILAVADSETRGGAACSMLVRDCLNPLATNISCWVY